MSASSVLIIPRQPSSVRAMGASSNTQSTSLKLLRLISTIPTLADDVTSLIGASCNSRRHFRRTSNGDPVRHVEPDERVLDLALAPEPTGRRQVSPPTRGESDVR